MKWLKKLFGIRNRHKFTTEDREMSTIKRREMSLINRQLKEKEEELEHKIQMNKIRRLNERIAVLDNSENNDDDDDDDDDDGVIEESPITAFTELIKLINNKDAKNTMLETPNNTSKKVASVQEATITDVQIKEYMKQYSKKQIKQFKSLDVDTQKKYLKQSQPNLSDVNLNKIINYINK